MKKMFLVAIFCLPTMALEEATVYNEMVNRFEKEEFCPEKPQERFWKRKSVLTPLVAYQGPMTYKLRFSKFGCSVGKKGAMVIAPGRAEASPEYYETALDFIKAGFSPIYVIDHRGQGLSPRELKNPYKGHVSNFMNYVSDLDYAVEAIVDDLKTIGFKAGTDHLMYTSNSMGGGIGLGYFAQKGEKNPFTAAAILGAMIRVNYLSFIDKEPTVLNNMIYSEAGVIAQAKLTCRKADKCEEYARAGVFGDYQPGTRNFVQYDSVKRMEKYMTHSSARYDLKTYLWDEFDWSSIVANEYQGENWIGPQLGGATFSWTLYTTQFLKKMRKTSFIKKLPDMPLLVLTGSRDLRAYKPYKEGSTDLSRHSGFCDQINKKNRFNKKLCTFMPLKDSFHEIYKESDEYRDQAIRLVSEFFEKQI
ncbi:MAG: alpha/beta hydrolase [Bacteriovoracaceae bacterium]|nr:alpha/beta hydrolase [Bacteriovoracaceae bacterium]